VLNESSGAAPDGLPFRLITLRNSAGMVVTVMDWGATLLSARVPLSDGSVREALLGCATPEHYIHQNAFLGASVGRYANRIAKSQFVLDGETWALVPSQGENQLHGGPEGFDKRRWLIERQNDSEALLSLTSPDGDQGFPGKVNASVLYRLGEDNRLAIEYRATTDKPCPVNLTNHAYFNLNGEQSDVRSHRLQLLADAYLPVDSMGIPTGDLKNVAQTSFDFRQPKTLAQDFLSDDDQRVVKGYDHAFLLQAKGDASQPAAHVWSADNKLQMSVYTSAPALQFYSGNFLEGTPARGNTAYSAWQGLALESEFLPDSPNRPDYPHGSCILRPGDEYVSLTEYHFIPA